MNITNQADLIVDAIANEALGLLKAELNFIRTTRNWPEPQRSQDNSHTYRVPSLGSLGVNVRAPEADVTYQNPAATSQDITVIEYETSFIADRTMQDSQGMRYLNQYIQDAVATIAAYIEEYALGVVAQTVGLGDTGTLGVAIVEADVVGGRVAISNAKHPKINRFMALSVQSMADLLDIDKYSRYDAIGNGLAIQRGETVTPIEGFMTFESPYVYEPGAGQARNLQYQQNAIMHIFPPQEDINDGPTIKRAAEMEGIRLSVLRERVSGKNGGLGYTISTVFGIKVVRPTGVNLLLGRS